LVTGDGVGRIPIRRARISVAAALCFKQEFLKS
jgi:hypothetical protein